MDKSLWMESCELPEFPALDGDLTTDVLIIGGGLAGILCAYHLEQAGVSYALVEADRICRGVTGNTTAKITSQHGLIYNSLTGKFGAEAAKAYWEANQGAIEKYRELAKKIDCDFEIKDSFLYATGSTEKLEAEMAALERIGAAAEYLKDIPLPIPVTGAIRFRDQAQFNPLKFVSGIVHGLNIFERTRVLQFVPGGVQTNRGNIRAKKIIVATHFPILNKHGGYFLKMYQSRSYVLAVKNASNVNGMYLGIDGAKLSFRNQGDCLLLGGGSHRTGKKGEGWAGLERFARIYYPKSEIVCRWAAQDCMTLDGMPYIGLYSPKIPEIFVAAGFNKWGMTSSMAAAEVLTDMVLERENPYAVLFRPDRSILRSQLFINLAESTMNLLTPTVPRCPHLGCALKWNPQEHSWDCPCHGSRFSKDGKLLDNPATGDMK